MQPGLIKLTAGTQLICSRSLRHVRLMSTTTLTMKNVPANSHVETTTTNQEASKWDLYAGVCLERKAVVTKELTPLEKKFAAHLAQYELELSKKSNHEIRHETDKTLMDKIKSGELDQGTIQTAQDFEDLSEQELKAFKPASRITDADKNNDTQSLERSLDSRLLFVVSAKVGNDYKWIVPQLKRVDGETMRQVADRTLTTYCPTITASIFGNAPWGFYKYKYPKGTKNEQGEERTGAKIFFYKAQIVSGEVTFKKEASSKLCINNYGWLKRSELPTHLHADYFKAISGFLIPEY